MSSVWEVLGLDGPTDDQRAIKKAYAKKLRTTRPDDDPEGFMALREALEQATYYAQYPSDDPQLDDIITVDVQAATDSEPVETAFEKPTEPETLPKPPTPTIIDDVQTLMQDPFGRADIKRWTALFNDRRLEGIDEALDFEENFRSYLLDLLGYYDGAEERHNQNRKPRLLSTRVGNHIYTSMGWRDLQGRPFYVQDQLEWLRRDLDVLNQSSEAQKTAHYDRVAALDEEDDGMSAWKIAIGLFVLFNIARVVVENYGNGSF